MKKLLVFQHTCRLFYSGGIRIMVHVNDHVATEIISKFGSAAALAVFIDLKIIHVYNVHEHVYMYIVRSWVLCLLKNYK